MNTDEMRKAIDESKTTLRVADNVANDLAEMLDGRLQHVHHWRLKKLKKQLQNYNMHTGRWKS